MAADSIAAATSLDSSSARRRALRIRSISDWRAAIWPAGSPISCARLSLDPPIDFDVGASVGHGDALSGGRRESHPPAPTDPGVNLSVYRAPVILITRRS